MSTSAIPCSSNRDPPPAIGTRWWIQVIGHIPFVGIPIVASSRRFERQGISSG